MAASGKSQSPTPTQPAGQPTVRPTGAAAPPKVRAGMGDVVADFVEIYSDDDYARATGLLSILTADGRLASKENALPTAVAAVEPATWLAVYRSMSLLRRLDQRLMALQREGRVAFYAEGRGQEATVVPPLVALEAADWVVPSHREGGAALYRGLSLPAYVAQVFGNANHVVQVSESAPSGPGHPAAGRAQRFLPMSSGAATQLPQAAGIAWAAKIKREKTVVLAYLGEGATSAEDFHAGINFAAVFKVPAVFICVNNVWSLSTPLTARSASETFAVKALAYGIPGVRVDGNDVFAVYAATREAVERARRGEGPTLIEAVTYRLGAHSPLDEPARQRDPAEDAKWNAEEPLSRFRTWLTGAGILDPSREAGLQSDIDGEINDAIAVNMAVPPPPLRTLIENVYVRTPRPLEEQLQELEKIRSRRP